MSFTNGDNLLDVDICFNSTTFKQQQIWFSAMLCIRFVITWWRHQMETFSALLAICAGNSPVPGEFPAQRPVTRSFHVFFDLRLNKPLSKQSWGWWFEMLSRSLWRHRNDEARETLWFFYSFDPIEHWIYNHTYICIYIYTWLIWSLKYKYHKMFRYLVVGAIIIHQYDTNIYTITDRCLNGTIETFTDSVYTWMYMWCELKYEPVYDTFDNINRQNMTKTSMKWYIVLVHRMYEHL